MNRKERRAAQGRAAAGPASSPAASAAPLLVEASRYEQQGKLAEAARLYKRALAVHPHDPQALNNLACVLLALGDLREASTRFARALTLAPELLEQYEEILATCMRVNPPI